MTLDNQHSIFNKFKEIVLGQPNNSINKKPINKESDYKEILQEYNKCVMNIKPDDDKNKCDDIIEIYKACVS